MKQGYIALNESNCGLEIFGVYRDKKYAERCLRRVIRARFGKCPRNLDDLAGEPYSDGGDESYGVMWFEEYKARKD